MKALKKLMLILLILLVIAAGAMAWILMNYHVVGMKLYPKNVEVLDLRGEAVSVEEYAALTEKMPGTQIRWYVPFQGEYLLDDTAKLTVSQLSDADVEALSLMNRLESVSARQCTDYDQLLELRQRCPQLEVTYLVRFAHESFSGNTTQAVFSQVGLEDGQLLKYLPDLKRVAVSSTEDPANMDMLQRKAKEMGLEFGIVINGKWIEDTTTQLEAEGLQDGELALLPLLPNLRTIHIVNPETSPEALFALEDQLPGVAVTWEVTVGEEVFSQDTAEIDLTKVVVEDLEELEARLACLPELESVTLGLCGIDNPQWGNSKTKDLAESPIENEDLAAYRDRVRDDYKVVWTVRLGPDIALRTDADNFMPGHFGVGRLFNDYAYNLRYCEEMRCLDVGHMTLTDVSFLEFMPHLKYLILAHTEVQYIEPIRHCKELVFLELDWSCIRDYSPLVDCTALEDLNIGNTFCDITPVLEMKWLKNLWMIMGDGGDAWLASQALPDTHVVATGTATVASGWRRLPNYYDMRDALGMYYMN